MRNLLLTISIALYSFCAAQKADSVITYDIVPPAQIIGCEGEFISGPHTEIAPEPKGGYSLFFKAVIDSLSNRHYSGVNGTFWIQFEITKEGKMNNIQLVKGESSRSNQQILEVFKSLDYPFSPAKQRGRPVPYQKVLPIKFEEQY